MFSNGQGLFSCRQCCEGFRNTSGMSIEGIRDQLSAAVVRYCPSLAVHVNITLYWCILAFELNRSYHEKICMLP